jgi:hypothetical protein
MGKRRGRPPSVGSGPGPEACVNPECGKVMVVQSRGLCRACYNVASLRKRFGRHYGPRSDGKETTAELDAMIAVQMRPENLPPWWNDPDPDDVDGDGNVIPAGVVPWVLPVFNVRGGRVVKKGMSR